MATKKPVIPAQKNARGSILISPLDPRLVIDESKNNSRKGEPWDRPAIEEFAANIAEYGQLQECKATEDDKGNIHIVWGFGRALAVKLLAETSLPKIMLRVNVTKDMSDDRAADENVVENHYRRSTNAADDAIEMKRRIDANYTVEDVAKLFRCSVNTVENYVRLTRLPKRHLDAMRSGLLTPTTAQDCLKYKDADERNRLLDTIVKEAAKTGKSLGVRDARRVIQRAAAEPEEAMVEEEVPTSKENGKAPKKQPSKKPRHPATIPDVRDMWTNYAMSPVLPPIVNTFGEAVMAYLKDTSPKNEEKVEAALQAIWLASPEGAVNTNGEDVSAGWLNI